MQCKFLDHGVALSYDQVVKPCCAWKYDKEWSDQNHISQVDLVTWHNSKPIVDIKNQLAKDEWPTYCQNCRDIEDTGRGDSMRLNAESAYSTYNNNDITLEIRPGSVCNFACQTCWPEASTRVAQYHHKSKLIDIKNVKSASISDFEFLIPIAKQIRNVVLLGGEPFYDKNCLNFLDWAQNHLSANITLFTNGSMIKWDWIQNYQHPITVVFSIDAVAKSAEYIRFGTKWETVYANYLEIQKYNNVELRVNITTSVYNYIYIEDVIDILIAKWPLVVSFGSAHQSYLREAVIPVEYRQDIVDSLCRAIDKIKSTKIETGQQHNAINCLKSIAHQLENLPHDVEGYNTWCRITRSLDLVKKINIQEYCKQVGKMLQ